MTRQPETAAILQAKAELTRLVAILRAVRTEALQVVHRLRAAAKTAPVVAIDAEGKTNTAEGWMADSLEDEIREELGTAIRVLAGEARCDWRAEIRRVCRETTAVEVAS